MCGMRKRKCQDARRVFISQYHVVLDRLGHFISRHYVRMSRIATSRDRFGLIEALVLGGGEPRGERMSDLVWGKIRTVVSE